MLKIELANSKDESQDMSSRSVQSLRWLFPDAFVENKIDFDVLKQLLGESIDEHEEKYGLSWHGKSRARKLATLPSTGTLLPCPGESVDWNNTQNILIEGDNLEVLKLLHKSYANKVKLIYIDPPYNTGKDFVYPDNFQDTIKNYLELTGQADGTGAKLSSNNESSGRYHTNWLNMMYPRLKLARTLLREDGVIAISVDDHEIERLRLICAEVFGEENFAAQISVQSNPRGRQSDTFFATVHEYLLVYVKSSESSLIAGAILSEDQKSEFSQGADSGNPYRLLGLRQRGSASLRKDRPDMFFPIYVNPETLDVALDPKPGFSETVFPRKSGGEDGRWMWGKDKCRRDINLLVPRLIERRAEFDIFVKDFLEKDGVERSRKFKTIWEDKKLNTQNGTQEVKELLECAAMSFPKPIALLQDIIQFGSEQGDLILDFFAGSGTTGHAIYAQNAKYNEHRRWVLVQLPELLDPQQKDQKLASDFCDQLGKPRNIAEITKERLRRAAMKVKNENPQFDGDLGFRVFKLDSSNVRPWEPTRNNLQQLLFNAADHLDANRTEQDILFELVLKLGLQLTVPIEEKIIAGKNVHSIGTGVLIACLATNISANEVEPLALGIIAWYKQLSPTGDVTCVFRDSAFADDVAKSNLIAILQQHGIKNIRSL